MRPAHSAPRRASDRVRREYHSTLGLRKIKKKKKINALGSRQEALHGPDRVGVYEGTAMCSGSEAGSHLRLMDFVYHPVAGWRTKLDDAEAAPDDALDDEPMQVVLFFYHFEA